MSYWVVGGIYKNTDFNTLEVGCELEKFGPFNSYDEAKQMWDEKSWEKVDNCYARYIILPHK